MPSASADAVSLPAPTDGDEQIGARPVGQVGEMQRRRLVLAATDVVCQYGVDGATVGRICQRAGVSRRTFYDLYRDREECFLDVCETAYERTVVEVTAACEGVGRWRERVRAGLLALLGLFDAEPAIARLLVVETLKGGSTTLRRRSEVLGELGVLLDRQPSTRAGGFDVSPLTAESTIGGVIGVIHTRLVSERQEPLLSLAGPLMAMIVLPYMGPGAARKELATAPPATGRQLGVEQRSSNGSGADLFKDLRIRLTFRTVRVLDTIASRPQASNREIGQLAGVHDQGQMSKLLHRLEKASLIENHGEGQVRGERNSWHLTPRGQSLLHAVTAQDS